MADVAPILKENCLGCHSGSKKGGKLDLSSYASLRKGGGHEDPIVAGQPDESLLVQVLTAEGARLMPPADKGGPLSSEQRGVIEAWVRAGARLDDGVDPAALIVRELRKRWVPPQPPSAYPAPLAVTALAFGTDGRYLVVGGYHELTVWNLPDLRLTARLPTRAERTYGMAFLADGTLAVAGGRPGQEGDVCLYDLTAAALQTRLLECDDSVNCVAVSRDGKYMAAGGCDRTARVWDISRGPASARLVAVAESHADWVTGVAFAADNHRLITASRDKTAKVFDIAKNEPALSFPNHQAAVHGVAVRADGTTAYSVGADRSLRIWKADGDAKQIKAIGGHGDEVLRVICHPAQPIVATASSDRTVRLWKDDGSAIRTLKLMDGVPFALAFSPDGLLLAAGSSGGEVVIWSIADGKTVKSFQASPGWQR